MLTGRYAFRNMDAILSGNTPFMIDHTKPSLPKVFEKTSYKTAVVGKCHLGLGDGFVDWNKAVAAKFL